jgi:hypothetical protein
MSSSQCILFQKPVYVKYDKGNGNHVPAYVFNTTMSVESITVFAEVGKSEITALVDGIEDNKAWYIDLLNSFVSVANHSFNKSYSVDALTKHIKHSGLSSDILTIPTAIEYRPKLIMLAEGSFCIVWTVQKEEKIDVPDLETNHETTMIKEPVVSETLQPQAAESSGLDELDADSIPLSESVELRSSSSTLAGGIASININATGPAPAGGAGAASRHIAKSRQEDKRKIHEAHLRLKLAQYKAEKAIAKYIEKYGDDDLTDFDSDDDTDFSSDEESAD